MQRIQPSGSKQTTRDPDDTVTQSQGQSPTSPEHTQQEGSHVTTTSAQATPVKKKRRRRTKPGEPADPDDEPKRRVVTTACIACRKRKSKCDGNTPACAACSQVYGTPCIYDPNSDHRRKGVYKRDIDGLKTRESTLQHIVQAILNYAEEDVPALIRQIRTCESLDEVAEGIVAREQGLAVKDEEEEDDPGTPPSPTEPDVRPSFESQLGTKMGELRLDDGSVRYIGGTSHLLFHHTASVSTDPYYQHTQQQQQENPTTSWTTVTSDPELITHLLNLYFTWHYSYFTCLSRSQFYHSFLLGRQPTSPGRTEYCTPLLVNAMLALGCHFTSRPLARSDPTDPNTAGDHFFREAKRLIVENDEYEKPRIATVQALALMSVREAGCGREGKGWVYSGMAFRMACDMGMHLDSMALAESRNKALDEAEEDTRRITFWGCFLFDKCWSNYLGRLPQLPRSLITCPKFEVFPDEDGAVWVPYGDGGMGGTHKQPARTRAVALRISALCEISGDLMRFFYNPGQPSDIGRQKGKQAELKKLSEVEIRLEEWRRSLPKEMEPKEGALSSVFIMHMFFQLLFIHLFRPFLKYNASTSPLPPTVSPRKVCTTAATTISRLLRLYKRSYGLRQICNICVYIIHTACTIHLLNLPDRDAKRDIIHGVKHLEEIAESWPCARRTLSILSTLATQWKVQLPPDAATVLSRCEAKFGAYSESRASASPSTVQAYNSGMQPHMQPENFSPYSPGSIALSQAAYDPLQTQSAFPVYQEQAFSPHSQDMNPQVQEMNTPIQNQAFNTNTQMNIAPMSSNNISSANVQPYIPSPGMESHIQSADMEGLDMFGGVEQLLRDVGGTLPSTQRRYGKGGSYPNQHQQNQQWNAATQQRRNVSGPGNGIGNAPGGGASGNGITAPDDWMVNDQRELAWGFNNWEFGTGSAGLMEVGNEGEAEWEEGGQGAGGGPGGVGENMNGGWGSGWN